MDEITLFAELKPPPPEDLAGLRARARVRLDAAMGTPAAGTGRPATGRSRRGRRIALGLSAVAVAACAATVLPSVLFGGHSTTLATPAYAVTRGADGTVIVTIYDIASTSDAASLQRALRAEGVAALVRVGVVTRHTDPVCQAPVSNLEPEQVQEAVVRTELNGHLIGPGDIAIAVLPAHLSPDERASEKKDPGVRFIIHPSAMPGGSALYIRRELYAGPAGQPWQQEIGPPEVLKHPRVSC